MTEIKCTEYVNYEYDEENWYPCQCPVCAGFLTWKESEGEDEPIPICNKCKTELIAIPYEDEIGYGKICPISKPKKKELVDK